MTTILEFGPFRLDADAGILFHETEPTGLGRRAVALLRLLLERAGAPVSKDALIEAAWPGLAVEDSNLAVQIAALRRILEQGAGSAGWIETMPRRGYRFVGPPVAASNAPIESIQQTVSASARPDVLSVAILPFSNLNANPEHEYFSDGMVEDVITALSRFKSLFVIARNSSFVYKGKAVDIKRVGRELGVGFVVEGSVRTTGNRLRVTTQLVDAATGYQLWTERYDRELEDIFAVQDEIATAIVSALPGRLEDAGRDIAIRKQTSNITAYDLVLLGNERWRSLNRDSLAQARECFERAVALDTNYARAHANITWTYVCEMFLEVPSTITMEAAFQAIETALDINDDDAWSHGVFAQLLFLQRMDDRAEIHFNRALALNPNDADVAAVFANILVYWGRWREALTWIRTAKRLNPFPPNLYHWYHALALYSGHEYELAIKVLQETRSLHCWSHGLAAACYAQMGLRDEGRSELDAFVKDRHRELSEYGETPPANDIDLFRTRAQRYRNPRDREHLIEGLNKAAR
jgi:TolB-like protein